MGMGIDIKDIVDVFPFIADNLSECAYIIIISMFSGFFIGKHFEKKKQKNKIVELCAQLSSQEETTMQIRTERDQLKQEIQQISQKYETLQQETEIIKSGQISSSLTSLSALERMLDSKEGQVQLTAFIEVNYKKDKEVQEE